MSAESFTHIYEHFVSKTQGFVMAISGCEVNLIFGIFFAFMTGKYFMIFL